MLELVDVFQVPCPLAIAKANDANWQTHRHNKVITNIGAMIES